jgi:hypothetical protein
MIHDHLSTRISTPGWRLTTLLVALSFTLNACNPESAEELSAGAEVSPAGTEAQPAGMNIQPAGTDIQPAGTDIQPAGTDIQPAGMDVQPAGTDIQPAGMEMTPAPPTGPISACEDFGSALCFANEDCNPDGRCESVGEGDDQLPCCVQGPRGTAEAGAPCTETDGQLTCASSLCITAGDDNQGYCSGSCSADADCPTELPSCIPIAFSGSDSMWCSPAQ